MHELKRLEAVFDASMKRDPKRIDVILDAVREIWERDPDLRLGQLLVSAIRPTEPCPQIFYKEDDALLAGLASLKSSMTKTDRTA